MGDQRLDVREAMIHHIDLLVTLAAGIAGALALGYVTRRLGWSPIVGYLLAGILIGPHTPGFVANHELSSQMAEVGVSLLMFGVGLHFRVSDLLAVRRAALTGAVGQSLIATLLGATAVRLFGWPWPAGLVFGLALSVASTVVLTRVLSDHGQLHSPTGRIAVGWLIVEDLFTVLVLVLLPAIFVGSAQSQGSLPAALGIATLKLVVFVSLVLLAGGRAIPWFMKTATRAESRELFTLSVLAVALGLAAISARVFGLSVALGAFLAGVVVGRSDFSARAAAEALPMRDAFAVMFFLSFGMLFNPATLFDSPLLTLSALVIVLVGKPLVALVIMAALGHGSKVALGVAIALAQIGEFSFLIAILAKDLGVLPETAVHPLVAVAILSIMLNPFLYRLCGPMEERLQRMPRLWRMLNRRATGDNLRSSRPKTGQPPAEESLAYKYLDRNAACLRTACYDLVEQHPAGHSDSGQSARIHDHGRAHDGIRHRRDHGDLQRERCDALETCAAAAPGQPDDGIGASSRRSARL